MLESLVKRILSSRVYDVAIESPLDAAPRLSLRLGHDVLIKREDMQPVFSFKLRGAYNKVAGLPPAQKEKGIIAASAGNHAQGVALAAQKLRMRATIVMPVTTPDIKVSSVRARGARVVLHGDTFDECFTHAMSLADAEQLTFIHPYDDLDVIAGQGTVAMEILRQHQGELHAVFIPVGGGGLVAGMAAYIKYLRPDIRVIGVEPEDAACLQAALAKGRRVTLPQVGLFADGVAVAQIGKETFHIARQTVDDVITVNTDEICAAIKDIFEDTRAVAEPAGAIAIAGLKKYASTLPTHIRQTLCAVNSGANMNFDRLRHVAERAEIGEKREALLAVTIPEKPGSFRAFCSALGKRNITEFNYRYSNDTDAQVFVGVQLGDPINGRQDLTAQLERKGYAVVDLSDNEMAKLHLRYMVGGHSYSDMDEVLYRFEFPERPGALLSFLQTLGQRWNISLFHYRNHGAAYGRVLVGFQVKQRKDKKDLEHYLDSTGFGWHDESSNPVHELFLK